MPDFFVPDWPAPPGVRALQTGRQGGVSEAPWASFNLGEHVGDAPAAVAANRALLRAALPGEPVWLQQVHGTLTVDAENAPKNALADAAVARSPGVVCAVMTADCLPVLLSDRAGRVVAAVHAGWRGLQAGVIESAVARMAVAGPELLAWLGPAIGPAHFEVGDEVRAAFCRHDLGAADHFLPSQDGRWLANLAGLATRRLHALGVTAVYGGRECTHTDAGRYFSYRREGVTGRMASLIWRAPSSV